MGYSTDFEGHFTLDRPLTAAHAAYLRRFSVTRRMVRDPAILRNAPDPLREAAGLPVGMQGEYFVGVGDDYEDEEVGLVNYNRVPHSQPGENCQWTPTEDGRGIEWDGVEKFNGYVEWLEYMVIHFFDPWGYVLGGHVDWQGEDDDDFGRLVVTDNDVQAIVNYDGERSAA